MALLSVAEAARRLGVDPSRVRQLLRSGALAGERVGHVWVVDRDALAHRHAGPPLGRRPLAPGRAWGLLMMLSGAEAPWLDAAARSRVRAFGRRLVDEPAPIWLAALRARSQIHGCWVHPAALERLRRWPGVLEAGAAAAVQDGADLVVVSVIPEFYVRFEQWPMISRDLHVRGQAKEPNVFVRVPEAVWPFPDGASRAPGAVLAADLLESHDDRAVRAGLDMLHGLAQRSVGEPS